MLPYVSKILVTQLDIDITDGDSFFPEYENDFEEVNIIEEGVSNNIPYRILEMARKN
jgi:dihydrofolate reductase